MNVCSTPVVETLSGGGYVGEANRLRPLSLHSNGKLTVSKPTSTLPTSSAYSIEKLTPGLNPHWFPVPSAVMAIDRLDIPSMELLHRDGDSHIGFCRKPDPNKPPRLDRNGKPYQFENLFMMPAKEMRATLPGLLDQWLTENHDLYMTVNGYYRAGWKSNDLTGLPDVNRKEPNLRRLNACYLDVEAGREESGKPFERLHWGEAWAEVQRLIERGTIPPPSMYAASGRGLYLFWLLHDPKEPSMPQPAFPEKRELYKQVNRALGRMIETHVSVDHDAHDAARILRVPGSTHQIAKQSVRYFVEVDGQGRGFSYTLGDLAGFCGIHAGGSTPESVRALTIPGRPGRRATRKPGTCPKRANGNRVKAAKRVQDIITLEQHRGGFRKRGTPYAKGDFSGGRRIALTLFAQFLRQSGEPEESAKEMVEDMGRRCIPPWGTDPGDPSVERIIFDQYRMTGKRFMRADTICAALNVSEGLAKDLELSVIVPPSVKDERIERKETREQRIRERRAYALTVHGEYTRLGKRLSCHTLAKLYDASGFTGANPQTANLDLHALGLVEKKTKPAATGNQTSLALA